MPSAYTAPVADGTITDLRTFALRCARGMGACVTMRDVPLETPPPDRFEPRGYEADRLAKLEAERAALLALTPEQAQADKAKAAYDLDREQARERHAATKANYEAMIAKVEAWEGAPEGVKEFALEQLREGLRFDCGGDFTFWRHPPAPGGAEWRDGKLAELAEEIVRATRARLEEEERTRHRNEWIAQLHASLGEV